MARVESKKPSVCRAGPVTPASIKQPLNVLQMLVTSCFGPRGRLKQIHNDSGGCVTTTSQSSVLLRSLTISHPALQLLVASIRNHVSSFNDGGLFAAILCCNLLDKCLTLPLSHHKIIALNRSLLNSCLSYLTSEDCACKVRVDFSCNSSFLNLARSVISSKPACMLTGREVEHVTLLVVKAFLFKVPTESVCDVVLGRTVLVSVEGPSVMDSTFVPGVLIEIPGCNPHKTIKMSELPLTDLKLALYSISLSGDFGEAGDGTLDVMGGFDAEQVMLDQLLALGKRLVFDRVTILLCQKVIHPSLKQYLKEQKIIAVERLGAALMEPLSQMTGAQPISSLGQVSSSCYGTLQKISPMSCGSKHYLHLIPHETSVCSLLLCNRNETSLKELVRVCQTAEHTLQLLLKDPWLLLGGGCTETHLAAYIRWKSTSVPISRLEELSCSVWEYKLVSDCFSSCLEAVARGLEHDGGETVTDLQDGHCWMVPPDSPLDSHCMASEHRCGCHLLRMGEGSPWSVLGTGCQPFCPRNSRDLSALLRPREQLVLDSFSVKVNALKVAVDTAGLILDLGYIIKDEN